MGNGETQSKGHSGGRKKHCSLIRENSKSHQNLPAKSSVHTLVSYYLLKYQLLLNKLFQANNKHHFLMLAAYSWVTHLFYWDTEHKWWEKNIFSSLRWAHWRLHTQQKYVVFAAKTKNTCCEKKKEPEARFIFVGNLFFNRHNILEYTKKCIMKKKMYLKFH